MAIHEVVARGELAEYVDAYWWTDGAAAGVTRILPDGCADIVFDRNGAYVVGTMTRPLHTEVSARIFGIRFRPGRAALVLRAPLTLFTDTRVPLSDLTKRFPPGAYERIADVESVLRRVLADADPDRRVDAAIEAIVRSGGRASIEGVASDAGVSRQHLARSFAYHVGVSPKTFARVIRFRRALALARGGREGWADLAAELGYFDQSHLIAEFRQFAGETPVPFFQSSLG